MIKLFHPLNIRGSAERLCEAAVSSDGESYDTSEVVKSGISGMKTLSFKFFQHRNGRHGAGRMSGSGNTGRRQ